MVRFCLRCSKTSNNCPHGLINSREYLARSNFIILSPNLHMLLIIKSKNSRRSKFIVCKNINNSGLLSPVLRSIFNLKVAKKSSNLALSGASSSGVSSGAPKNLGLITLSLRSKRQALRSPGGASAGRR